MDSIWLLVAGSLIIPALSVLLSWLSMRKAMDHRVQTMQENDLYHLKLDLLREITTNRDWLRRLDEKLDRHIIDKSAH